MKAPPNYGEKFPKNFEKTYSDLAKKYDLEFMPFLLEGVAGNPAYNQADGIHPNAKGYLIIADNIYPYIIKALK
jgi:acyl-CoA thioesterase-1